MPKFASRFLMFTMLTTSLLAVPLVTQGSAATSHKHMKKRTMVTHQSPRATNPGNPGANPFASKYEDDFDRKSSSGGGGY